MRVILKLRMREPTADLPVHYAHWVQAAVYGLLSPAVAEVVHDEGFPVAGRRFRLFAFSRLIGRYEFNRPAGTLRFLGPVLLVVSSPIPALVHDFANAILRKEGLRIGPVEFLLDRVTFAAPKVYNNRIFVRTLSPVTVYSTLFKPDGTRYTAYFDPHERQFAKLVAENLTRKHEALFGCEGPSPTEFQWKPRGRVRLHVVRYQDVVIKAYSGTFEVQGPPELLQIGVDAGWGAKNAQGFGLTELVAG